MNQLKSNKITEPDAVKNELIKMAGKDYYNVHYTTNKENMVRKTDAIRLETRRNNTSL